MTTFEDGPAKGQTLMLKTPPLFLRVVEGKGWDALDQREDKPEPSEKIYAYERIEKPGMVHLNFGGGRGGFYPIATYRFVKNQPPDDQMRTTEAWQTWCRQNS